MRKFSDYLSERLKINWLVPPVKWEEATVKYGPDNKYSEKILVSVPPRFTIRKVDTYPHGNIRPLLYDKKDKREYLEDDMRSAKSMAREILDREQEWQMKKASHDFKDFKDPWAVMTPEDRKEANRLTNLILKAMPSSPRQKELQAKRNAILAKYKIGQKK